MRRRRYTLLLAAESSHGELAYETPAGYSRFVATATLLANGECYWGNGCRLEPSQFRVLRAEGLTSGSAGSGAGNHPDTVPGDFPSTLAVGRAAQPDVSLTDRVVTEVIAHSMARAKAFLGERFDSQAAE